MLVCQSGNGQTEIKRASSYHDVLSAVEAERKTGAYILYRQHYIDSMNRQVSYHGSIYGAIQSAEFDGCSLKLDVMIVDLFSGLAGKSRIENLQDTESYTFSLTLTRDIANAIALVDARPTQLKSNTHSVCPEHLSCTLTWIKVEAKGRVIKETRATNRLVDFDGYVSSFLIPVSSAAAGKQFISQVQSFAEGNCK